LFQHALPSRLCLRQDQVLTNTARAVEIMTVIYDDLPLEIHPLGIHSPGEHPIDEIPSPGIRRENRLRARLLRLELLWQESQSRDPYFLRIEFRLNQLPRAKPSSMKTN